MARNSRERVEGYKREVMAVLLVVILVFVVFFAMYVAGNFGGWY